MRTGRCWSVPNWDVKTRSTSCHGMVEGDGVMPVQPFCGQKGQQTANKSRQGHLALHVLAVMTVAMTQTSRWLL